MASSKQVSFANFICKFGESRDTNRSLPRTQLERLLSPPTSRDWFAAERARPVWRQPLSGSLLRRQLGKCGMSSLFVTLSSKQQKCPAVNINFNTID